MKRKSKYIKTKDIVDPRFALTLSNLYHISRHSFISEIKRIHKEEGARGVATFLEVEEKELEFVLKKKLGIFDINVFQFPGCDAIGGSFQESFSSFSFLGFLQYLSSYLLDVFVRKKAVKLPPGTQLDRIAEFFSSPKTYQLCLRPTISDMQTEYFAALAAGRVMKARWVRMTGYWAFWKAWGVFLVVKTVRIIIRVGVG